MFFALSLCIIFARAEAAPAPTAQNGASLELAATEAPAQPSFEERMTARYDLEVERLNLVKQLETRMRPCNEVRERLTNAFDDLEMARQAYAYEPDHTVRQMIVAYNAKIAALKAEAIANGDGLQELRDQLREVEMEIIKLEAPPPDPDAPTSAPTAAPSGPYVIPTLDQSLEGCFPGQAKPK